MVAKKEVVAIPVPGSLTWPFKLGDEVKDKISGLRGTAMTRHYHVTGCDQFSVELKPEDGKKPPERLLVPGERLELVKAHPERWRPDELPGGQFALGDKVRGLTQLIDGKVGIISVPLYGAVQLVVYPPYNMKEGRESEAMYVDEHMCEMITPHNPDAPKPAVAKPAERGAMKYPKRHI